MRLPPSKIVKQSYILRQASKLLTKTANPGYKNTIEKTQLYIHYKAQYKSKRIN